MFKIGDLIKTRTDSTNNKIYRITNKLELETIEGTSLVYYIEVVQHTHLPIGRLMKFHSHVIHQCYILHRYINYNKIWSQLNDL